MSEQYGLNLRVARLIGDRRYEDAFRAIKGAEDKAKSLRDTLLLEQVLAQYVLLYSLKNPPDLEKAEYYSRERERLSPTGDNKLQTAFLFYWTLGDLVRARTQTEDALQAAKDEGDTKTLYQGLGLLGLILLDLQQWTAVVEVFKEVEEMIAKRQSVVVGDETLFLERMYAAGLEKESIAAVARILAPACRDPEFAQRLKALF